MIRILINCFFLISAISLFGQESVDKKVLKLLEKGDEALKERDFPSAKSSFSTALSRDSTYGDSYVKLIGLHNALRQSDEVYRLQLRYVNNVAEKNLNTQVWQSLAYHEFGLGYYGRASEYITKAKKVDSLLFKSIQFSLNQIDKGDILNIKELPPAINRFAFQYLPTVTVDDRTIIYTARRSTTSDEDIVVSDYLNGEWSEGRSIAENINTKFNEGACSVSADGRTLIFTSCEGRQSFGNCDLYITTKTGITWSKPENLGRKVNSTSWDSQPALSADGKTLYFVSNRPGGIGGRDIWVTVLEADGWTYPKNVGSTVNTIRDETTPFIHSNNQTLFFSSNGHVGMGGFDLYKAERINQEWKPAENLGFPINTFQDEVSLIISPNGTKAYFAKEESTGGILVSSRLVTYDIPEDRQLVARVTYITGVIRDSETKEPLESNMEIIDLKDRSGVYSTSSDTQTGRYYLVLPSNREFGAFIEKANYLFEDLSFSTLHKTSDTVDIYLQRLKFGAKMILKNIYFGFDSDEIDAKSFEELDRVADLMKSNPNLKVEISGHTDNVGSSTYNMDLSKRRARRVFEYLVSKSVPADRMISKGYGDAQPLNSNQTEDEMEANRRIEFKILSSN